MTATPDTKNTKQGSKAPAPKQAQNGAPTTEGSATPAASVPSLTIAAAAKIADVSPMTMRNAVKNHPAFKVSGAVVQRNMRDEFGNETEHPATYVTRAAIDAYIEARKAPGARTRTASTDPKRRVIRLTDEEVQAYNEQNYAKAFARNPKIEVPQVRTPKPKGTSAATGNAAAQPAPNTDNAQQIGADQQTTLFDVALTAGDGAGQQEAATATA